ncbi:MAG: TatD family deoxyribonuclease [Ruminococcaceae bacterium]|nr:TatD family deoxyribonuclease [Oscillospiraceae bacterium]
MIFDSHAHYNDKRFDDDRRAVLSQMLQNEVCGIINCGTDLASSQFSVALTDSFDGIYAAVGFHPEDLEHVERDYDECAQLLAHKKVVAVGEIGLDYYWDAFPRPVQQEWFVRQMQLAKEHRLPVIVHDRDAHEDTLTLLKQERPQGVLHAFSGSVEMAKEVLNLGMYIGLGGVVTFQNARKTVEVAQMIPLDRLLLETDAPYMAPVPFRGRRNDSTMIRFVAARIAELRGMETDEILEITTANAKRVFGI